MNRTTRVPRHMVGLFMILAIALVGRAAAAQVFTTPKGEAENVRFEQVGGGTVHIVYDLVSSDPRAIFLVTLDASQDRGSTYTVRPTSVSGDVGEGITPGPGKRIVWESGRDVERLEIDQFRFRISAQAGPLELKAEPAPAIATGSLAVVSDPAGATVMVDGTERGQTPLDLATLAVGSHKIVLSNAGYLDNAREVAIVAGQQTRLDVTLTPETSPAGAATPPPAATGGGGATKWLLIGGAVAAAGGIAAAAGGGGGSSSTATAPTATPTAANRPPVISTFGHNAPDSFVALVFSTTITFEVNASDADGNSMTARWAFGDGTNATAPLSNGKALTTKTYEAAGAFRTGVQVGDGRGGNDVASYPEITANTVTGLWTGRATPAGFDVRLNLIQNGTFVNGDYVDSMGRSATFRSELRFPRTMEVTLTYRGGGTDTYVVVFSADLKSISTTGRSGNTLTLVRQ